jgi:hypothetical protein
MANPRSIDDMKALLSRRGGIARGNRYGVHIAHPLKGQSLMVDTTVKQPHKNDIDTSFIQDGRDTWMLCSAVTLPGKRISTTEATHNHNLSKKPYSMATDEVSMTFLLTNDYYMKKYFDLWQELIINSRGNHYKTSYKDDYCAQIDIHALNNKNENVGYGIKLEKAYPIQVSQVEFSEGAEGLMELTVTWEYDNWRMTHMDEGFIPSGFPTSAGRLDNPYV